jgi:bifunctional DNA-binding transcriptional regulator/antitoxin component of YhaV-PrlF toxin-antitoxin module
VVQKHTARLMRLGRSCCIVIPKKVIDGYGWVKGQDVQMMIDDNGIYIPTVDSKLKNIVCKRCNKALREYQIEVRKKKCQSNIISHHWIEQA